MQFFLILPVDVCDSNSILFGSRVIHVFKCKRTWMNKNGWRPQFTALSFFEVDMILIYVHRLKLLGAEIAKAIHSIYSRASLIAEQNKIQGPTAGPSSCICFLFPLGCLVFGSIGSAKWPQEICHLSPQEHWPTLQNSRLVLRMICQN